MYEANPDGSIGAPVSEKLPIKVNTGHETIGGHYTNANNTPGYFAGDLADVIYISDPSKTSEDYTLTFSFQGNSTYNPSSATVSFTYYKKGYMPRSVSVSAQTGGTASADTESCIPGTTVHLTAFANTGYSFDGWNGKAGDVTISDNQFVMGDSNVEIEALFKRNPLNVTLTARTEDVSYATDEIVVISGTLLDEDNNPVVNQTVSCDGITVQTDATGSYQIQLNAELTDSSLLSQSFTKTIQFEGVSGQYNPTSKTVIYSVRTMYAINFDPNKDHGGDAYIGSKNGYDAQLIYFFSDFDHGMLGNGDKNNPPFMDGIYFAKILRGKSYAFLGWAYDKDATVPDFKENDSFNNLIAPDEIVTLYAIWEDPIKITRIDAVVDEPIEGNTITRNLFLSVAPEEATIIQGAQSHLSTSDMASL